MFSHWNHLNSEHDHHQMVLDDQSDVWQVCKTADGVTINRELSKEAEALDLSVATVSSHPSQNLGLRSASSRHCLMAIKHGLILIGGR